MRSIPPPKDLPDNIVPAKFAAPPEMNGQVNDIVGLIHQTPEGETNALEFQFQITEEELKVLRYEPYLTLTILADHLHPFALQTSFPPDEKYDKLIEHHHLCDSNLTHTNEKWWRCDNPSHEDKHRTCDECWHYSLLEGIGPAPTEPVE